MSNDEVKIALFILLHRTDEIRNPPLHYCMDLHNDTQGKDTKTKDRIAELLRYRGEGKILQEFENWSPAKFPITGYDLFAHNVPKGPAFSKTLSDLRQIWKESAYTLTKKDLVERIPEVVKKHT
jgi:tRNA nucleotidyltransferase (CCA-adding enzyme)